MTTVDESLAQINEAEETGTNTTPLLARIDRFLERSGEYLNPILVKETRQALKSKQFSITFTLLLVCVWVWSLYGVAWLDAESSAQAAGLELFHGYFAILAFPLIVVVPFGAFRSLSGEREDRTYELLSITTLKPRQIISGKLGSAVLQMIVYLSAVAPCLAFTYLLRGIDILTILFTIGYIFFASLAFCVVGLLIATLAIERYVQAILSVALILGLFFAFAGSQGLASEVLRFPWAFYSEEFWVAHAVGATIYVGYFALFFLAAAAQLSFATENRSSKIRVVMVLQFAAFAGWMATIPIHSRWQNSDLDELALVFLTFSAIHWTVMGMFMVGESSELSPRVRRDLPKSFLGRILFTWFNPGPATGYVFCLCGMLCASILAVQGMLMISYFPGPGGGGGMTGTDFLRAFIGALILTSYVTIYLGLAKLVTAALRRWSPTGTILSLVVTLLLFVMGAGVPMTIHMSTVPYGRYDDYTMLQVTNPFWTMYEMFFSGGLFAFAEAVTLVLVSLALVVFALNIKGIFSEVRFVRIEKPHRVQEEDAELAATLHPRPHLKKSPWDE